MKEVAIKDICHKDSSALKQKELLSEGKYPVFGASGIAGYLNTFYQEKEYIGIVKDGSGIGRVAFYPAESSLIGTMQYILPKEDYDIRYIGYCLQSLDFSKYKQGAAIPHIYFRDYGERFVKVTDNKEEQRSIVARLDAAFSHIDALKANAEKQLSEAKVLFQKALDNALKNENWRKTTLNELCHQITDGTHRTPKYTLEGIPFLSVKNVTSGYIDMINTKFISMEEHREFIKRCNPQYGDILYTKVGTTGIAKVIDVKSEFSIFVSLALLKIKTDMVYNYFLEYVLNSPYVYKQSQKLTSGAANRNFLLNDIKKVELYIPPLSDQQAIVSRLDALSSQVRNLEENCRKTLAECDALKQAMLREVFK